MRNIVILNSLHFSYPLPILMRVSYNTLIVKQNTSDYYKYSDKRGQSAPIRILPNESILGFVQDANEPNAKANKFVFCRNKISTTKLKIRKAASPYGNKRRRPAT